MVSIFFTILFTGGELVRRDPFFCRIAQLFLKERERDREKYNILIVIKISKYSCLHQSSLFMIFYSTVKYFWEILCTFIFLRVLKNLNIKSMNIFYSKYIFPIDLWCCIHIKYKFLLFSLEKRIIHEVKYARGFYHIQKIFRIFSDIVNKNVKIIMI